MRPRYVFIALTLLLRIPAPLVSNLQNYSAFKQNESIVSGQGFPLQWLISSLLCRLCIVYLKKSRENLKVGPGSDRMRTKRSPLCLRGM